MSLATSACFILISVLSSFILFSISLGVSSSVHEHFPQCPSQHSLSSILKSIIDNLRSRSQKIPTHHEDFLSCLNTFGNPSITIPVYTPKNSSYTSILEFPAQNLRFLSHKYHINKPQFIVTPMHESQVPQIVICYQYLDLQIKIRSGGHDYEGISYTSDNIPFIVIDMFNIRSIDIDIENRTAWVQSGATLGELYHKIAERSPVLGFPGGVCPSVGVGGFLGGGGYGNMLRKYGLAADNVIDARIVDVNGRILDKETMGEDLFWAIRGGSAGGSFGVILSWKIRLVPVPSTVTVFTVDKTLEQNATELVYKWQDIGHELPNELLIRVMVKLVNSKNGEGKTVQTSFNSLFLGNAKELVTLMGNRFPELGLQETDCMEMSWIKSVVNFDELFTGPNDEEILLSRIQGKTRYKAKSDYVQKPISRAGLEGLWKRLLQVEDPHLVLLPYGGKMNEISESEIPFPHRKGNIFKIQYLVYWDDEGIDESEKHISWMRKLYNYMTPYVSKSPRAAYMNYRDLDLGQSKNGTSSYSQAKAWGSSYFKNNFERLV